MYCEDLRTAAQRNQSQPATQVLRFAHASAPRAWAATGQPDWHKEVYGAPRDWAVAGAGLGGLDPAVGGAVYAPPNADQFAAGDLGDPVARIYIRGATALTSAEACREECVKLNRMFSLYQPKADEDGSLTGVAGSHLCMCSNTCNYSELSVQLRTGSDLQTIGTSDCIPNPDPASGKSTL